MTLDPKPIPYGRQCIEDDDVEEVVRVLRSEYLTTGPEIDAFEAELARACGSRFAVVVANGTAALHCAYAAIDIRPGDEVITTPLTFSATSNMVLALGGRPVFADVQEDTLCLDLKSVEQRLGPRTKAIATVDFAGHPADQDAIMAWAEAKGLAVIEDAAHSIGGVYHGRPVGSLSHVTTFSFHPVKTITTGEGGAVLTDDPVLYQRVRDFRNHGLVREPERLMRNDGGWYYEIQSLGLNYRMTAMQAALGRSQLRKLPRFSRRRAEIVSRYREAFANEPRLRLPATKRNVTPAWHLFTVRAKDARTRAALFAALQRRRILVQVHYVLVSDFPFYRSLGYRPEATPIAHAAADQLISLPLYPALEDAEVERVIEAVRDALDEASPHSQA